MKRIYFISALLLFILVPVSAQESIDDSILLQMVLEEMPAYKVPTLKIPLERKIDFGFRAGVSLISAGNNKPLFSQYFAPEMRYQATPKFSINTGVMLSQGHSPFLGGFERGTRGIAYHRVLVYAEGDYKLNDRMSLSGMMIKDISPTKDPRIDAFNRNAGIQAMSMGLNYRVTNNIHFGAHIIVSDRYPMNGFNSNFNNSFSSPSSFPVDPWW